MPNIHQPIRDHVTLSTRCLDRLYLRAYMPKLQTSAWSDRPAPVASERRRSRWTPADNSLGWLHTEGFEVSMAD